MKARNKKHVTPLDVANKANKALQKDLDQKKLELDAVKKDREIFRRYFVEEFRNQLECMTKKQYYTPESLIKRMTSTLNECEKFYLGL